MRGGGGDTFFFSFSLSLPAFRVVCRCVSQHPTPETIISRNTNYCPRPPPLTSRSLPSNLHLVSFRLSVRLKLPRDSRQSPGKKREKDNRERGLRFPLKTRHLMPTYFMSHVCEQKSFLSQTLILPFILAVFHSHMFEMCVTGPRRRTRKRGKRMIMHRIPPPPFSSFILFSFSTAARDGNCTVLPPPSPPTSESHFATF